MSAHPISPRRPVHFVDAANLPRDAGELLRYLVRFGMEAPSSHNTQPWLFRVRGMDIEVHGNPGRKLAQSDPSLREFFISLGCAVENIVLAASYYRLPFRVDPFPVDGDPLFVATIHFSSLSPVMPPEPGHIALEIPRRHANREPFDAREIPAEALAELRALSEEDYRTDFVTDPAAKARIAEIVGGATTAAFNDKGFTTELSQWIKPGLSKYKDGMTGYNLGIPFPASFVVPLAIRHANVTASQRKMADAMLAASAAFLVISTKDGPAHWVGVGRLLERIWLTASKRGINMGILAAAIEMEGYPEALADVVGTPYRPQVFARLGYSPKVPPASPRLSLQDVLIP